MAHYSESNPTFTHPLRFGILASYIPALVLCSIASDAQGDVIPGLGLVPLSISAGLTIILWSIVRQARKRKGTSSGPTDTGDHRHDDPSQAPWLLGPVAIFLYDVFIAAFLLIVLLVAWISPPWSRSQVMLFTYATVPLLQGFVSHVWLALVGLWRACEYAFCGTTPSHCPNCDAPIRASEPAVHWWQSSQRDRHAARGGAGGYHSLLGGDEDVEQYHDDVEAGMAARRNLGSPPSGPEGNESAAQDRSKGGMLETGIVTISPKGDE